MPGLTFSTPPTCIPYGGSEIALGKALAKYKRNDVLISTKSTFRFGPGPNNVGSSRYHLIEQLEGSLKRLGTDYVDVYHLHAFDALTPVEETLNTLDQMVRQGKIRYIACSNFSGWHLMKSLSVSERYGWSRYVGHQVYYSLVGRDYEHELDAACARSRRRRADLVATRLGPAHRQNPSWQGHSGRQPTEQQDGVRCRAAGRPRSTSTTSSTRLDAVAQETEKTIPQVALNWLLRRPTVSTLIIGARNEEQLKANLGSIGWTLTAEQIARLDAASVLAKSLSVLAPGTV